MKRTVLALVSVASLATLTATSVASANVKETALYIGRLTTPRSCFVQVDLTTVEQNMFNGQEKLRVGGTEVASFSALKTMNAPIAQGKSVLFGSPSFQTETGVTPDVSLADDQCQLVKAGVLIEMLGSFGPVSSSITLREDFSELDVVGLALTVHLEQEKYRLKSLTAEKELGGTGASSGTSGAPGSSGTSGSSSSGASGSAGSSGTSGASPTTPAASSSDDGGCSMTQSVPRGGGVALAAALALVFARQRRRR